MESSEPDRIVSFNCGGKVFSTTLSTLRRSGDNFLSRLATTEVGTLRDDKGRFFLDRNPALFRHVLEYLRCGSVVLLDAESESLRAAVEAELRFFSVQDLPNRLTNDVSIRQALALAHTRFVDSWLDKYDALAKRLIETITANLQELASTRKLLSKQCLCSVWWSSSVLAEGDPSFPDSILADDGRRMPMKNSCGEWFSDFHKTFALTHDGDQLEVLEDAPTEELVQLLVSVTKHFQARNLSVEVVTLFSLRKPSVKKGGISEMETAFRFFQRRTFGMRWTGNHGNE